MPQDSDFFYDAITTIGQGRREQQEDALAADFPVGAGFGFAVLADGMGGHAAGDVASKIVVTEIFSELKMRGGDPSGFEHELPQILADAAESANDCLRMHVDQSPESEGMGATVLATVIVGNRLYWLSVGDSPLYLYRDGELTQLNEDHSMGPEIDRLAAEGRIGADAARFHPDRNCLTSALLGEDIPRIDCPTIPFELGHDDLLIVASDGLQFLDDDEIAGIAERAAGAGSTQLGEGLMTALDALDDPDQDNTAICAIRILDRAVTTASAISPIQSAMMSRQQIIQSRPNTITVMATKNRAQGGSGYNITMEKLA